jgi:two-component system, NarL family, invasion response regulator UvrY
LAIAKAVDSKIIPDVNRGCTKTGHLLVVPILQITFQAINSLEIITDEYRDMKKFLIVDDHEIVRQGLKLLIKDFYPAFEIDEACDGISAEVSLKSNTYALIILDIQMPRTNSFELLEYIVNMHPETKVLIFSMSPETIYGKRVIGAGAHGYLSKEASIDEIKKALETVLSNRRYVSPQLLEIIMDEKVNGKTANPFSKLSAREFEITTFLLAGMSVSEVAQQAHLQPSTVGTYKARIFEKLNVSNLFQLKELASIYNFS